MAWRTSVQALKTNIAAPVPERQFSLGGGAANLSDSRAALPFV
jgi:hypothetical protein